MEDHWDPDVLLHVSVYLKAMRDRSRRLILGLEEDGC